MMWAGIWQGFVRDVFLLNLGRAANQRVSFSQGLPYLLAISDTAQASQSLCLLLPPLLTGGSA